MHQVRHFVFFISLIALVFLHVQNHQFECAIFEESRFVSGYVLSERQSRSAFSCVGHCLQNPECTAVRFTRSRRHCQLFSDVLWLYGSEIPQPDSGVIGYKMVNT